MTVLSEDQGVRILDVAAESPAERAGIRAGDRLVCVAGEPPSDVIDYQFRSYEPVVEVEILTPEGAHRCLAINKAEGEPLGLSFEDPVFDRIRVCRNHCRFCFIDQLPEGLRDSLYLKDDDYRLSFLYGNFISLTNLGRADIDRIIEQRISPLYISLHATNPDLRSDLMGSAAAGESLEHLKRLTRERIEVHIQIVACPGINDGRELRRTLKDLQTIYGPVASVGVVPVGLTAFREKFPEIRAFAPHEARGVIRVARRTQARRRAEEGTAWLYLADEFYLLADEPLPPLELYDDLPQIENGIGLTASFVTEAEEALRRLHKQRLDYAATIVTGALAKPLLQRVAGKMERKLGITLKVIGAQQSLFGGTVSVTPLLSGQDIRRVIERVVGPVWLPDRLLNRDGLLLDGMDGKEVAADLPCTAVWVPSTGAEFVRFALEWRP